jgi:hypothetical protein
MIVRMKNLNWREFLWFIYPKGFMLQVFNSAQPRVDISFWLAQRGARLVERVQPQPRADYPIRLDSRSTVRSP